MKLLQRIRASMRSHQRRLQIQAIKREIEMGKEQIEAASHAKNHYTHRQIELERMPFKLTKMEGL